MQEIILDVNLMQEALAEQEAMLVTMLEAIVKLEVTLDVNNIKGYSLLNILLYYI